MSIEEIAAKGPAPFGKHDAASLVDMTIAVERTLMKLHTPIGTTQLVRLLLPQPLDTQMKSLVAWLALARTKGVLAGCYTQGKPTAGTFGKPRIHWLLTAEKRADIQEEIDMGEPE